MYFLDNDMNILEAKETTVYRIFGGDVSMEGRFITNEPPTNPIQARMDLALSQRDFVDSEGMPIRNLASQLAVGTVFTDDEGHLINLKTGEVTDSVLEFKTVEATSDMKGGGMEFNLGMDFENMVQVDGVSELQHHPTEGWTEFVQAEDKTVDSLSLDENQEMGNQGYAIDSWYEASYTEPDDATNDIYICGSEWYEESHVQDSMNLLLDDEENSIQKKDVADSWYESGVDTEWVDPDEGMEEKSRVADGWYANTHEEDSIDLLIDDEIYEIQKSNLHDLTEEVLDEYTLQQNGNYHSYY